MKHPVRRWTWASKAVNNMRDLGGYLCDGGYTRYGVVLRSDQLVGLKKEEMELLVDRGLCEVIDLRSDGERAAFPNDFTGHPSVRIHTVVLNHNDDEFQFSPLDFSCMGEMYRMMVDENGAEYARMLRAIADSDGLSIVHCMAGKDRTGIVCGLLLLLLGVDECDVVADYQISETHLTYHIMGSYATDNPDMPKYLMKSDPKNMRMLISHLNETYGGAELFLRKNGLDDQVISRLRARMVASE